MEFSPQAFAEAFAEAPRPSRDQITTHQCCECERLRADLAGYTVDELPDRVVEYHADSIPLLSPAAFRYFLPRYVRLTCEKPDTSATDFVLFNLCPDDRSSEFWSGRCDTFTRLECEAIVCYLSHRQSWPDADVDAQWIQPALEFWRELAASRQVFE